MTLRQVTRGLCNEDNATVAEVLEAGGTVKSSSQANEHMHEHLTSAVVSNDVLYMLMVQCAIQNKKL